MNIIYETTKERGAARSPIGAVANTIHEPELDYWTSCPNVTAAQTLTTASKR